MDKQHNGHSRRHNRSESGKANSHKDFPNHLIQRPVLKNQESRTDTRQVPFLERKTAASHQSRPTTEAAKARVPQREVPASKREERTRNSLPVFAQHKSRRPFRPTRLPSTWRKRDEEEEREYDFPRLKTELRIANRDLILLDLNPPVEEERASRRSSRNQLSGSIQPSRNRPKRALHRSLSGIMEQERVQDSRKQDSLRLRRKNQEGYSSYFE